MEMKLNQWRPGTAPIVSHEVIAEYIQDTAFKSGVGSCIRYNTRVEHAFKQANKWLLETSTLNTNGPSNCKKVNNIWVCSALDLLTDMWLSEFRSSTLLSLLQADIMPAGCLIYLD
jgi:hypothetical protein